MGNLFSIPWRPVLQNNLVVPGAKVWFTLTGTDTPSAPYSDAGLTTHTTNPLIADGVGKIPLAYIDPGVSYRVRIYAKNATVGVDDPIEEYDPYLPGFADLEATAQAAEDAAAAAGISETNAATSANDAATSAGSVAASAQKITNNDVRISLEETAFGDTSFRGLPGTPATGTAASTGTYVFVTPLTYPGWAYQLQIYALNTTTVEIKSYTLDTTTNIFTVVQSVPVTLAAGLNTIDLTTLPLLTWQPGYYLGLYIPASRIPGIAHSPSDTPYYLTSGNVAQGGTFAKTGKVATTDIQAKILVKRITRAIDGAAKELQLLDRVGVIESGISVAQTIGKPTAPVSGANLPGGTFVLATPVANPSYLKPIRVWCNTTGTLKVRRFVLTSGNFVSAAEVALSLQGGQLNTIDLWALGLTLDLQAGDYLGWFAADNVLAVNSTAAPSSTRYYFGGNDLDLTTVPIGAVTDGSQIEIGFDLVGTPSQSTAAATSLILPSKAWAVQGQEFNVYKRDLTRGPVGNYYWDMPSSPEVGKHGSDQWRWTPSGASTTTLTVNVNSQTVPPALLSSASMTVIAVASTAKASTTVGVNIWGDSIVAQQHIQEQIVANAAGGAPGVTFIGTRGTAPYKHEGRGGWRTSNYTNAGLTDYLFTVSGVVTPPVPAATQYTNNGATFTVQEVNLSGGSGTIRCSTLAGAPSASGTLTKSNTDPGDATIAFSASAAQPGNPMWNPAANGGAGGLDFGYYLSNNSLPTPDYVILEPGIADVDGATSDSQASSLAASAVANLTTIINAIHAYSSTIKIGVSTIPAGSATQNGAGEAQGDSMSAWRVEANVKILNKAYIAAFDTTAMVASNVWLIPAHFQVDRLNNYWQITRQVNARNSSVQEVVQTDVLHPAPSGAAQWGDAIFAFVKAV